MSKIFENKIEFKVWGRYALFTDPLTKIGGEKFSYQLPTYEALKGVLKSIYWKPTIIWIVDEVRLMKRIQTQTKGMKPLKFHAKGNELSIYTFLFDVEYQVKAHFEWNEYRVELSQDRIDGKHFALANRMLERGGRQDIFLGTRDCQGYVEPCKFGEGNGAYDEAGELAYSLMFHGFDYPDETNGNEIYARFWRPVMKNGVIKFKAPQDFLYDEKKFIREMQVKTFSMGRNVQSVFKDQEDWVA
jgi:CRISPR-associated protein Cas5d